MLETKAVKVVEDVAEAVAALPMQMNDEIVALALVDTEIKKQHDIEVNASHKALWDKVHEVHPELDRNTNYTLDCKFAEQGVVMLSEAED
ncbi:hypothetical protein [Colwellia piezophila]|uniref:hypothetical protein n=1 Tax=Colwellia piezophila TaxID=211668 RepID=UPI000381C013|nr:hypothetical protein [Colwellia piezophila]